MTVQELINQALLDLGAMQAGDAPSAAISNQCLTRLNQLLSSLSVEGASVYSWAHSSGLVLVAGTNVYTIGAGSDWDTTVRPVKIVGASTVSGGNRKPLPVISYTEFDQRALNIDGTTKKQPDFMAVDNAFPEIHAKVFPPPGTGPATVDLDYWVPLTPFATLGATVDLPDAWERMLHFNLAVDLVVLFPRMSGVNPALAANAQNSKNAIILLNRSINGDPTAPPPAPPPQAQ